MMTGTSRGPVLRELECLFQHGTLCGLGDDELLERFLDRRDGSAFEALVALHGPMVLGICRRMLHDPRDVEDAFQATFLVLVRKAITIRDRGLLSSWLYGVAYRVANRARTRAIQRHGREIGVDRLEAYAHQRGVPADFADIGSVLDQELNRLPAKYREPIVLCYLEGRTHDQAAKQLGCPVGTVRSRMARGRDLLRRGLTRRGCTPVAALLGGAAPLPSHLAIESVPAALLAATVRSALAAAALRSARAGTVAAPILTLTQGVLTTMKLSQLAWSGLAIFATSLSAAGVIAVAFARGQTAGPVTVLEPSSEKSAGSPGGAPAQIPTAASQSTSEAFDARLRAIETKLDALLRGSSTTSATGRTTTTSTSTTATSNDPLRPGTATTGSVAAGSGSTAVSAKPGRPAATTSSEGTALAAGTMGTVRELEIHLKLALLDYDDVNKLFQRQAVSDGELERYRGKVLLATAALQVLDDDLSDELDRLRLEMKKKAAELNQAEAQREIAASIVARNRRLNERKPGVVSDFDVAKAEGEVKIAEAAIEVKKIEIEEVALRAAMLTRRRTRIQQAIKLSERATTETEAAPPAPKGR